MTPHTYLAQTEPIPPRLRCAVNARQHEVVHRARRRSVSVCVRVAAGTVVAVATHHCNTHTHTAASVPAPIPPPCRKRTKRQRGERQEQLPHARGPPPRSGAHHRVRSAAHRCTLRRGVNAHALTRWPRDRAAHTNWERRGVDGSTPSTSTVRVAAPGGGGGSGGDAVMLPAALAMRGSGDARGGSGAHAPRLRTHVIPWNRVFASQVARFSGASSFARQNRILVGARSERQRERETERRRASERQRMKEREERELNVN